MQGWKRRTSLIIPFSFSHSYDRSGIVGRERMRGGCSPIQEVPRAIEILKPPSLFFRSRSRRYALDVSDDNTKMSCTRLYNDLDAK